DGQVVAAATRRLEGDLRLLTLRRGGRPLRGRGLLGLARRLTFRLLERLPRLAVGGASVPHALLGGFLQLVVLDGGRLLRERVEHRWQGGLELPAEGPEDGRQVEPAGARGAGERVGGRRRALGLGDLELDALGGQ